MGTVRLCLTRAVHEGGGHQEAGCKNTGCAVWWRGRDQALSRCPAYGGCFADVNTFNYHTYPLSEHDSYFTSLAQADK